MIDLSKGPLALRPGTPQEVRDALAQQFPTGTRVELKPGASPRIVVKQGLWRGLTLVLASGGPGTQLMAYQYEVPGVVTHLLLFALSVVVFSVLMMVIVSAAMGEFVPMVAGIGGIAGFMMYRAVEAITLRNIRRGWEPETERAIRAITATGA